MDMDLSSYPSHCAGPGVPGLAHSMRAQLRLGSRLSVCPTQSTGLEHITYPSIMQGIPYVVRHKRVRRDIGRVFFNTYDRTCDLKHAYNRGPILDQYMSKSAISIAMNTTKIANMQIWYLRSVIGVPWSLNLNGSYF